MEFQHLLGLGDSLCRGARVPEASISTTPSFINDIMDGVSTLSDLERETARRLVHLNPPLVCGANSQYCASNSQSHNRGRLRYDSHKVTVFSLICGCGCDALLRYLRLSNLNRPGL